MNKFSLDFVIDASLNLIMLAQDPNLNIELITFPTKDAKTNK